LLLDQNEYPNIVTVNLFDDLFNGDCFVFYDSHLSLNLRSLEPAIKKYLNGVTRNIEGALTTRLDVGKRTYIERSNFEL